MDEGAAAVVVGVGGASVVVVGVGAVSVVVAVAGGGGLDRGDLKRHQK